MPRVRARAAGEKDDAFGLVVSHCPAGLPWHKVPCWPSPGRLELADASAARWSGLCAGDLMSRARSTSRGGTAFCALQCATLPRLHTQQRAPPVHPPHTGSGNQVTRMAQAQADGLIGGREGRNKASEAVVEGGRQTTRRAARSTLTGGQRMTNWSCRRRRSRSHTLAPRKGFCFLGRRRAPRPSHSDVGDAIPGSFTAGRAVAIAIEAATAEPAA